MSINDFEAGECFADKGERIEKLSTGFKAFDELTDGGIYNQTVTEIYGGSDRQNAMISL